MDIEFEIDGIPTAADADVAKELIVRKADNTPATNKDGTPQAINLYGLDSAAYKRQKMENQRARLSRRNPGKLTPEELEEEGLSLIIAVTHSWTFKDGSGNPIPCTPATARKLYKTYPDVFEQADQFVSDRGNHLKT